MLSLCFSYALDEVPNFYKTHAFIEEKYLSLVKSSRFFAILFTYINRALRWIVWFVCEFGECISGEAKVWWYIRWVHDDDKDEDDDGDNDNNYKSQLKKTSGKNYELHDEETFNEIKYYVRTTPAVIAINNIV